MHSITVQQTDEGLLIPKDFFGKAVDVEIESLADYFLIKPKALDEVRQSHFRAALSLVQAAIAEQAQLPPLPDDEIKQLVKAARNSQPQTNITTEN